MYSLDLAIDELYLESHNVDPKNNIEASMISPTMCQREALKSLQRMWCTSNRARRDRENLSRFPLSTITEEQAEDLNKWKDVFHENLTPTKDLPIYLSKTRTLNQPHSGFNITVKYINGIQKFLEAATCMIGVDSLSKASTHDEGIDVSLFSTHALECSADVSNNYCVQTEKINSHITTENKVQSTLTEKVLPYTADHRLRDLDQNSQDYHFRTEEIEINAYSACNRESDIGQILPQETGEEDFWQQSDAYLRSSRTYSTKGKHRGILCVNPKID